MSLHFGGPQEVILTVFAVIALSLAALFTTIAISASRDVEFANVKRVGYGIRRYWLIILIVLATIQVSVSLFYLPYTKANDVTTVVHVDGYQFNWTMDKTKIPVDTTVRFVVTSSDVNHAFGLYDPDGKMVGVVQAMPGYHNKVDVKLDKVGKYHIWCLELCGISHDRMTRDFLVVRS